MNKKDNSGRPITAMWIIILGFIILFLIVSLLGCKAQEPDLEGYSIEAWNQNNAEWQNKLDSVAMVQNQNCDSLQAIINDYEYKFDLIKDIIDNPPINDTVTVSIYDTSYFWNQYVGDVEFEQVGYYNYDSAQHVYFKVRNFDTLFHDSIYVDIYQGGQRKLSNEFAREGMTASETFYRKYTSKFATDTSDYMFVLHEKGQPIDTATINYNNEKVFLHVVDSIDYLEF